MTGRPLRLSVIIPVYNEVRTIGELIRRVSDVPVEKEIIVVDDCSTDGSHELLDRLSRDGGPRVIHHERNLGKGAAIRTGLAHVTGDCVVFQDADLEYDPADYPKLLAPISRSESGRAGL